MINNLQKIIYRITCVAPVIIMSGFILWIQGSNVWLCLGTVSIGVAICAYSVFFIKACINNLPRLSIEVTNISKSDFSSYIYFATYAVPLISFVWDGTWYLVGFMCAIMLAISLFVHQLPFSPVMLLYRYHFYKVQISSGLGDCYLISNKKQVRNCSQIKYVVRVDEVFFIHMEDESNVL